MVLHKPDRTHTICSVAGTFPAKFMEPEMFTQNASGKHEQVFLSGSSLLQRALFADNANLPLVR